MNNIKEQERAALHDAIWKIANDLRGSVDGWDFKQYVLGMLFYRFISENITNYINALQHRAGESTFDYAKLDDAQAEYGREVVLNDKGFYILPGELFINVRRRAKTESKDLNETLSSIFRNIESSARGTASEDDIKGLFDDLDVNSNKLGNTVEVRNKKLVKLLDAIGELKLGNYADNTIDAFGDAYEYLMTMYAGVLAPKSKADLAFTMHMLSWLATNGTAAIVEFPGVLYRGGAEQKIRQYLIENNFIDTVIQLPPDLFFGTTIATCIIVLKKSKADNNILFIDAGAEFVRGGNKNKLTAANQDKILQSFIDRKDIPHFAQLVSSDNIAANDYNIAVSSYVEAEDTREVIDIKMLNAKIAGIVARQSELRQSIDAIVADLEG